MGKSVRQVVTVRQMVEHGNRRKLGILVLVPGTYTTFLKLS